ncbi:heme acquisition protein HasA [Pectobacterium polaris]|uniref:heme acquisition protein HasA n=1 Tax=Pectobacterium polaris TaxID=2042057 RepID=UPI000A76B096|nr:heme acquisition protein HasA [Pectobacterium polaris]ASY76661.1 hemophore HasA [Pectobacterium polaris]
MSFAITYDAYYANYSIASYLTEWSAAFGDVNHTAGNTQVGGNNTGGFYGGDTFIDGTQYAITSAQNDFSALIAGGDLNYSLFTPPAHTLYGDLDTLSFGNVLQGGTTAGTTYSLVEPEVTFSGLDLSTDVANLTVSDRGVVHDVIYGLMGGQVQPLLDALANAGIDINASLDSLSFATATADAALSADTVVDVVGVAETADLLAA